MADKQVVIDDKTRIPLGMFLGFVGLVVVSVGGYMARSIENLNGSIVKLNDNLSIISKQTYQLEGTARENRTLINEHERRLNVHDVDIRTLKEGR
jgi:hypothetical protein